MMMKLCTLLGIVLLAGCNAAVASQPSTVVPHAACLGTLERCEAEGATFAPIAREGSVGTDLPEHGLGRDEAVTLAYVVPAGASLLVSGRGSNWHRVRTRHGVVAADASVLTLEEAEWVPHRR
jgi:hypothetical protein